MSKSLKRVEAALLAAGLDGDVRRMPSETRTAQQAADAVGCQLDQIVKSMIFRGKTSGAPILFLTAGGNRIDTARAAEVANEPLGRAEAALVRSHTGFAIGGVAPIGHLNPITAYLDPRLLDFDRVWAAAGTPHHVFVISPLKLCEFTGAQVADFL